MALTILSPTAEHLALRTVSRVPVFSGAAGVARVLAAEAPQLEELLHSGSARNLGEALQQLNPSEQNQLRERWGRSLDELISLASERDATIFQHGLLEVGHRLEENDQLDLASVVYSALIAGNSPVLAPAQARLNAMNGVGDWRARLAFNLERLPTNATRWDMLFAMGGAGLVFRGVRLAATARWASSFESAIALNAAATSSAFLAETAAFTGFGRLFGTMAGNHYDWSAEATFNEWAGGAAMLLGLKAMGGMFGNLSERWAAGETAFARVTRAVAPQAGMFSGIVLGNRLAELGGFHPERHGDTWLVDGLTTLLEFNIAGRLQRGAGGSGLTSLEGRMEAYTRSMVSSRVEIFAPHRVTSEGVLEANLVFSMGNRDDPGPRDRMPTLLGLGGEEGRPATGRGAFFQQGQPYTLREIPEGAHLLRVQVRTSDLKTPFLEAALRGLREHPQQALVLLDEGSVIGRVEQGILRVELYRLLREKATDADTPYFLLLPGQKTALMFRRQHGIVQVKSLILEVGSPVAEVPEGREDRVSEVPERPSWIPEVSSLSPAGENQGYAYFSQLKDAFERWVRAPNGSEPPLLRLNHGIISERELGALVDVLAPDSIPDRMKWRVHWVEQGGGSLSFTRQGDRILARLRGSKTQRTQEVNFFLIPHESVGRQLRLVPNWRIHEFTFSSLSVYHQEAREQLESLINKFGMTLNVSAAPRLEDAAVRGQILARVAVKWMNDLPRSSNLTPVFQANGIQLHRMLERAYTLLDFETLRTFRERMGAEDLRRYETLIDAINRNLEREQSAFLVPLRYFRTDPEFEYVVPKSRKLREMFLNQLFSPQEGYRNPWQNRLLFEDPIRLGQILANIFNEKFATAASRIHLLKMKNPGRSLQQLFEIDDHRLTPDSILLRNEVRVLTSEFGEFAEIFSSGPRLGRAGPHRRLLRAAFSGTAGVYQSYEALHREFSTLGSALVIPFLFSPQQIQKYFELVK